MPTATYTTVNDQTRDYTQPERGDLRRSPGTKKKSWQVSQMWDRHHEIARMLLLGLSGADIARQLDISEVQVSNVRNSPVVKEKLTLMQTARDVGSINLAKEIADLAPIALGRVKEALETGTVLGKEVSAAQILKEANNVLDRDQGKAVQRVDARHLNTTLSMEDIERIKERAASLAMTSNQLVDL